MIARHVLTVLAVAGMGCGPTLSARVSRCEFGEFPIPTLEDNSKQPPTYWRPRTVEETTLRRHDLHRKLVVVSGYYRRAYEESHLWPSRRDAQANSRLQTPRIGVSEFGAAGARLRSCNGLNIIVYGEFISLYEMGEDMVVPRAIRVR